MFTSFLIKKVLFTIVFFLYLASNYFQRVLDLVSLDVHVVEYAVIHPLFDVTNGFSMPLVPFRVRHIFWSDFISFNGIIDVFAIEDILHLWIPNLPIGMVEFDHGSVHSVVLSLN